MILRLGFFILSCMGIVLLGLHGNEFVPKEKAQNNDFLYGFGNKEYNKVTWKAQEAAVYYSIQKSQDGSNTWLELKKLTANTYDSTEISIIDEGVGKSTYYRVVVVQENGTYISNQIELRRHSTERRKQYAA